MALDLHLYILDGTTPIPEQDVTKWGKWFDKSSEQRKVARTNLSNGVWVSTVFLGMDHSFGDSKPMLFETMIFGTDPENEMKDSYCRRCSTWAEALVMHTEAVQYQLKKESLDDGSNSATKFNDRSADS